MAITDKITQTRSGGDPVVATVATVRASAGATLACDDLSNWPADTVHFITYQKTAAGGIDYDTLQSFKGIVSGNNIGTVTLQHSPTGTDLGNSIGDYVEMAPTASWSQDLYDALSSTLNVADGTLQTGIVATAKIADSAVTTAKIADDSVTNAKLDTTSGELGGAWQTWTPTWTNFTIGSGTGVYKYLQVGKTVHFYVKVTLSGSTMGTDPYFSLPVSVSSDTGAAHILGDVHIEDTGSTNYLGKCKIRTGSNARIQVVLASGTYAQTTAVTASLPMTWANSDYFVVQGTYEAA